MKSSPFSSETPRPITDISPGMEFHINVILVGSFEKNTPERNQKVFLETSMKFVYPLKPFEVPMQTLLLMNDK